MKPRFCERCGNPLQPREEEGRERLACPDEACGFVAYGNPTPVVAAVVEHEGRVLLVRNKGWPEKWFGLVSGFLEQGEAPEAAIARELREELGLTAGEVSLVGAYAFPEMNQVILGYHVRASGEVVVGPELEAYKPVPIEKLRPWPFGTGHVVADWLKQRS